MIMDLGWVVLQVVKTGLNLCDDAMAILQWMVAFAYADP